MTWTRDTPTGAFQKTGTDREVVTALASAAGHPTPLPMIAGTGAYRVVSDRADHFLFIALRMSEDGRRSLEGGLYSGTFLNSIDAGARTGAHIYAAILRTDVKPYTTGSSKYGTVDPSISGTYAVLDEQNLSTGAPAGTTTVAGDRNVPIELRLIDDELQVWIKGNDTGVVRALSEDDYPEYNAFGFGSRTAGAIVKDPHVYSLAPIFRPAGQTRCYVSNGILYVSEQGEKPVEIGPISRGATTPVDATDYAGELYVLDGKWIRVFNGITREIRRYAPPDGSGGYKSYWDIAVDGYPPGAVDYPGDPTKKQVGTTTAQLIETHGNRLYFGGMPENPNDLWASRIGQPGDMNIGGTSVGRAYQLSAEERAGIAAGPVTCLRSYSDDYLLIGLQGGIQVLRGDPILQDTRLDRITSDAGIIGKDAAWVSDLGLAWVVTEQGLAAVGGSNIEYLSKDRLASIVAKGTDWVDFDTRIVHDSDRFGLLICFTPKDDSLNGTHLWFALDESSRGFFPERYPLAVGPTAVGRINDVVQIGTRDGHVLEFDDEQKTDHIDSLEQFAGIDSYAPLQLIMDPDGMRDTLVRQTKVILASGSDGVDIFWRGASTPERAYTDWATLKGARCYAGMVKHRTRVRGGAIVISISSTPAVGVEASWAVESVDVDADLSGYTRHEVPAPVCGSHGGSGSGSSGSGSGSGSGGTSGFGQGGSGSGTGTGGSGSGSGPSGVLTGDPIPGSGPPSGASSGSGITTAEPPVGWSVSVGVEDVMPSGGDSNTVDG